MKEKQDIYISIVLFKNNIIILKKRSKSCVGLTYKSSILNSVYAVKLFIFLTVYPLHTHTHIFKAKMPLDFFYNGNNYQFPSNK